MPAPAFAPQNQKYLDAALTLRVEGLSYREIGECLGVTGPAVYALLKRWAPGILKPRFKTPQRRGRSKKTTCYEAKPVMVVQGKPPPAKLPHQISTFIKPPTKQQLMAGR